MKSFNYLKTFKTIKDKIDNPHKSSKNIVFQDKNCPKKNISTAIHLKKHYQDKMSELKEKENHLREK